MIVPVDVHDRATTVAFRRPAELVEISEQVYRRIFAVGMWLATSYTVFAMILSLLQPAGSSPRGVAACSICLAALTIAARRPATLYGWLRHRPATLTVVGAAFGLLALAIGRHNLPLFLPMVSVIGVIGIAVPCCVVMSAALIAASGLAAPQLLREQADLGAALAVVVPPLMFWLIVDRIAGFALYFHQSLQDPRVAPAARRFVRTARHGPATQAPASESRPARARERRALEQPQVVDIEGTRLTTRQLQVVLLVCEGLKHAEIGACLGIGAQQVSRHLAGARRRTGCGRTPQLVAWARRCGLVPNAPR